MIPTGFWMSHFDLFSFIVTPLQKELNGTRYRFVKI